MAPGKRDKLSEDLSAYLDGELPPERTREIERQLAESEACRETLEQLRGVSDLLQNLPRVRAPDELTAAMRRRAERHELLGEPRATGPSRLLRLFVRLSAAAAVLGGCVLVGWQMVGRDAVQLARRASSERIAEATPGDRRGPVDGQRIARLDHKDASPAMRQLSSEKSAPSLALTEEATEAEEMPVAAPPYDVAVAGESSQLLDIDTDRVALGGAVMEKLAEAEPFGVLPGSGGVAKPVVEIWVTPQSAEQYQSTYAFLADQGAHGTTLRKEEGADKKQAPVEVAWDSPANEVGAVLADLAQRAPQGVRVAAQGVPVGDLRLVQPMSYGYHDDHSQEPAREARAKQVLPSGSVAGRRGGGVPDVAAGGRVRGRVAEGTVAATEEKATTSASRRAAAPRSSAVATPPAAEVTEADEAARPSQPASGMEAMRLFFNAWVQALQPAPPPAPDAVLLRVRLLPPPVTTQPAAP